MNDLCRYLVLAWAGSVLAYGQAINGSISGLVTDNSGASIAEVKITVTDVDRNTVFSSLSNDTGFYLVSQLPIGKHRITAEKSGFRTYVMDAFPLAAEQRAAINIGMEIGSTVSEVTVAAAPQLLESVTATLSGTVSNNQIVDLPLNNRNIYSLTSLIPGVFQTKTTSGVDDTFYGNHFIINGSQEATSDIVLDGVSAEVSHNVPTIPAISAIPSVEGIQEFRILTNSYPAEYGRSGGGVVIMVTKSGANTPQGSGFEFLRNSALDGEQFLRQPLRSAAGQFQAQPVRRQLRRPGLAAEDLQRQEPHLLLRGLRRHAAAGGADRHLHAAHATAAPWRLFQDAECCRTVDDDLQPVQHRHRSEQCLLRHAHSVSG